MKPFLTLVLVIGPLVLHAQPPRIWERATSGTLMLPVTGKLKIVTQGSLRVEGGEGAALSYTLRQRVKARGEAEAQRSFRDFSVRTLKQGEWTVLAAAHGSGEDVEAELVVRIPRALRQARCETRGGAVTAVDLDGDLQIESGGGRLFLDRLGAGVTARTSGGDVRIGRVRGAVRCVSGAGSIQVDGAGGESWFETAGGEISVLEAGGPVHAITAGGGVRVGRCASSVSARTAGGRIEVGSAGDWVFAENSGGPIQVGAAKGVRCESVAGPIRLRGSSGALRAYTGLGNIFAELARDTLLENSSLDTANGDITVLIPSNLALTVQAQNEGFDFARRIISEFAEIQVRTLNLRPATAAGMLNGGGPVLRLSAAGGTIYLRRLR